jgi:hypothetical protein
VGKEKNIKTKKIGKRAKKRKPGKVLETAAEKDSDTSERKKTESQREATLEAMVKSENRGEERKRKS